MSNLRPSFLVLLGSLALALAPAVAQPAAVSPIFQVNTHTEGDQLVSAVAGNGNGRFVAVWHSGWLYQQPVPTQDGSGYGVYAQVFDASGARIGGEIQVHQTTAGNQDESAVAMSADGGFVVVWRSETPVTFESRIFGRRFDPTGAPLGNEFVVSVEERGLADYPADVPLLGDVDGDGDDDFCVFTGDRFLCDTAHDGGAAEIEIPFAGSAGTVPVLGNLDGF